VPRNTHAPPTLSGLLSTAGQRDQSSVAMIETPSTVDGTLSQRGNGITRAVFAAVGAAPRPRCQASAATAATKRATSSSVL
jgi:hypothetical protein